MTRATQIAIEALALAAVVVPALLWLRWNTRLPIPGRAQDVRAILRRSRRRALAVELERVQP